MRSQAKISETEYDWLVCRLLKPITSTGNNCMIKANWSAVRLLWSLSYKELKHNSIVKI